MNTIRRTGLGRMTKVAAAGALLAMAGLSAALAAGPAASASPVPNDMPGQGLFSEVSTTATTEVGLLEKWNGTKWSVQKKVLPAGGTTARLNGISCTKGPVCEAVGFRENSAHLLALRYSSR